MALFHKLDKDEIQFVNSIIQDIDKEPLILFDVGTNRGLYIDLFLKMNKECIIHGFEPIPSLFKELLQKYKKTPDIILNDIVVSDSQGTAEFFELTNPIADGCSSIIERPVFKERKWNYKNYFVKSDSIDNYCRTHNINYIDFLKIDVEGAEFKVLKGCDRLLQKKKISYIQFEYGSTFDDAGTNLTEVFNYITQYGYSLHNLTSLTRIEKQDISYYSRTDCNLLIK